MIEDNEVWNNSGPGIVVVAGTGHTIRFNSIGLNTGLGIDLGGDGVTPNDPLDADTGPNNLQNYPVLTSATIAAGSTTVSGSLHSTPNTTFTLDFYGNNVASASEAEGEQFLGSGSVTTNANGDATFSFTFEVAFGNYVTATATDPGGNTSEFSQPVAVSPGGTGTISGRAWVDSNDDGIQDMGEPGLANVIVALHDGGGTLLATTVTGADGSYQFTGLAAGGYYMYFSKPPGSKDDYIFSLQDQGPDDADSDVNDFGFINTFALLAGQNKDFDAGLVPVSAPESLGGTATISGRAWRDDNGNGIQDAGEPGLANVWVALHGGDGTLLATILTAADGSYQFTGLATGSYSLYFSKPAGAADDYTFSPQDQGPDDTADSDVSDFGFINTFSLLDGQDKDDLDAGLVPVL